MEGLAVLFALVALAAPVIVIAAIVVMWGRLARVRDDVGLLCRRVDGLERPGVPAQPDSVRAAPAPDRGVMPPPPPVVSVSSVPAAPSTAQASHVPPSARESAPVSERPQTARSDESSLLETQIGGRVLLYVGVAAIIVGASYFVKLAFDNAWMTATTQVLIGGAVGAALAYGGTRFARAGYSAYGQMISGGGIAVLYVSIYAAFTIYALIPHAAAFALMCLATMLGAWLADAQHGQGLALVTVGGGFATPFLLATGRDAQIVLFTYDAILVAGTMYLAHRRAWPSLHLVSYLATGLTWLAWASRFYTPDKFLPTEIFLTLFVGMFLYILYESRRATGALGHVVRVVLMSAPAVYHLASIAVLYDHPVSFFVYVIAASVAGLIAARQLDRSWIRLIAWIAVQAPLVLWVAQHGGTLWALALVVVTSIYLLNMLALGEHMLRRGQRLDEADLGLLHLNGLVTYLAAYLIIEPIRLSAAAPMALGFALWHAGLAGGLFTRDRQDATHVAGLACALIAVAIALQFDGAWRIAGWAAEGTAVVWLGLREQKTWLHGGGALLLVVAVALLVGLQWSPPPITQLVLLNARAACGAFVIALLYGLARGYRRAEGRADGRARGILLVSANVLTVLLLSSEIGAYWDIQDAFETSAAASFSRYLAREVMLSMSWATYATGLIVAGLQRRYAPIRYLAIALFGVTILKVFMVDLAALEQLYRVLSVVGLGALLLVTSYLYQRFSARVLASAGDGGTAGE